MQREVALGVASAAALGLLLWIAFRTNARSRWLYPLWFLAGFVSTIFLSVALKPEAPMWPEELVGGLFIGAFFTLLWLIRWRGSRRERGPDPHRPFLGDATAQGSDGRTPTIGHR